MGSSCGASERMAGGAPPVMVGRGGRVLKLDAVGQEGRRGDLPAKSASSGLSAKIPQIKNPGSRGREGGLFSGQGGS